MKIQCDIVLILFLVALFTVFTGCLNNDNSPPHPNQSILFSGHEWTVKSSNAPVGPGPNYFSNNTQNVWIDESGKLHLRITNNSGNWTCAEIVSHENFGYGTYLFSLASPPTRLDQNVVLGLFTWDDAPDYAHREIDIEFSKWGWIENDNAQFVVQPWAINGNIFRFNAVDIYGESVHMFKWDKNLITFQSCKGNNALNPRQEDIIKYWEYTGKNIPVPKNENARINLWLFDGKAPSDNKEVEIIINKFEFIPISEK